MFKKRIHILFISIVIIIITQLNSYAYSNDEIVSIGWGAKRISADIMMEYLQLSGNENNEIVVAVIDSGIDINHPCFSGRIVDGYNAVDDNDDIHDYIGHGTLVSGVITNCTPSNVKIMPIKVFSNSGNADSQTIINGIQYAVDNGADVINISFSELDSEQPLNNIINAAINQNRVVVVAAGNSEEGGVDCSYYSPAGNKNAIVVSAIDSSDMIASFSNWGNRVDIAAPGVSIETCYINNTYINADGTSIAAAYVSAAAAMLIMDSPKSSPNEIRDIICYYSDPYYSKSTDKMKYYGSGIINLNNYIESKKQTVQYNTSFSITALSGQEYTAFVGDTIQFTLAIKTPDTYIGKEKSLILHGAYMKTPEQKDWTEFHGSYINGGVYTISFDVNTDKLELNDEGNYYIGFALFHADNYKTGQAITSYTCNLKLIKRITPHVSAGYYSSFAIKVDGSVWSWGLDRFYDLGHEKRSSSEPQILLADFIVPTKIDGLQRIKAVTATIGSHSAVIDSDNTVWTWGTNGYGQLGIGNTVTNYVPMAVQLANVVDVSVGIQHTIFLTDDGSVWTCGRNWYNQLGYKTSDDQYLPHKVPGLDNVIKISSGFLHSIALKADGTIWGWGSNSSQQIGSIYEINWSTVDKPYQIHNIDDVISIASGDNHIIALKSDGTVWAWGDNDYGQLGDGTKLGDGVKNSNSLPRQIVSLRNIKYIAAGSGNSAAIDVYGNVWVWGRNQEGQLGDGTYNDILSPYNIPELGKIVEISLGYYHMIALDENGSIWVCGDNKHGELGNGLGVNYVKPTRVLINLFEISKNDYDN